MNKNEKDFMSQLSNLDDFSVEEIAENYPALDKNTKKRILKKCKKKDCFYTNTDYDREDEITVSGIEHYNRASWYKYVSSAAAFVIAVVGIASVVMINRNLNGNNDLENETTPAVSIYNSGTDIKTEETTVTTSYTDYVVSNHDYVDDNEYSGSGTSQIPTTVDESFSGYTTEDKDTPVVNNNTTVQPATQVPVTSPPATQAPVTVTSFHATEPVTTAVQTEPQKLSLNGLYYVEIEGVSGYCDEIAGVRGYMGFEFWPDGRFTKYDFDDFGDVIYSTMITTDYEIAGNQFSFGDIDKKSATIINPNDTGNFSIQFDDGSVFNFSTEKPKFKKPSMVATKPDTLNGTIWSWYGDWDMDYNFSEYVEKRKIEFKEDGVSGTAYIALYPHDAAKRKITEIPFTYEQNGDEVTFYMEDSAYNILKATLRLDDSLEKLALDVEYQNGDRNFFALSGYLNN